MRQYISVNNRRIHNATLLYNLMYAVQVEESGVLPQRTYTSFLNITKDNQSDNIYKSRRRRDK